ncbi:MFS transporter small subunit [Cupriavidus necator]
MHNDRTFGKTMLLLAFWTYVLIPLGAGIWSTLGKAMTLFS